jgi:hypothetical protein
LHDLTLSPKAVRDNLFEAARTWMAAYFPADPTT